MTRPLLLDLFCGGGGASMGYFRAGFDVVGVDSRPQPHYPFEFVEGDALVEGARLLAERDFRAAAGSPPCQRYTRIGAVHGRREHPDLVAPTRDLFVSTGLPWMIENVVGSPLRDPATVCGSAFGLGVRRHRWFEGSFPVEGTICRHDDVPRPVGVYGNSGGTSRRGKSNLTCTKAEAEVAMGIDWMTWREMTQAIPPSYTEWVGRQMMAILSARTVV